MLTVNELWGQLNELREQYGDRPVVVGDCYESGLFDVGEVRVEEGNRPFVVIGRGQERQGA